MLGASKEIPQGKGKGMKHLTNSKETSLLK